MSGLIGALDIGGTKTIAALSEANGHIVSMRQFATNTCDAYKHLENCTQHLLALCAEMGIESGALRGLGVAVPGIVDEGRAVLIFAPFAKWHHIDVRGYFSSALGITNVLAENDTNICALGERCFGHRDTYNDFIWATLSTGIGSGVMLEGKLRRGKDNCAGELGHVKVAYDAPKRCPCGQLGCLEAHASGTAIAKIILEKAAAHADFDRLFTQKQLSKDAKGLAFLAGEQVPEAAAIFRDAGMYLARGFSHMANILNPQAIILGGGLSLAYSLMEKHVNEYLAHYVFNGLSIDIVNTKLGYHAAVIGAVALVVHSDST